jgi:hypothetical protein
MRTHQLLDALPIVGVFLSVALAALLAFECGYRLGNRRQRRSPEEPRDSTALIVGSLLALVGFLLAITMNMATERFDKRRNLVLTEANAVGTTYLRAGYLPEPASSQIKNLLREYVPNRILETVDPSNTRARIEEAVVIHKQIWSVAEALARAAPESDVLALFIDSLNQTIDLHTTRVTAGVYERVPETVIFVLILGSIGALCMTGYNAGLCRFRSILSALALIIVLSAIVAIVIDLDRPREGFLRVSQQPLIDLREQIGPPSPSSPPK